MKPIKCHPKPVQQNRKHRDYCSFLLAQKPNNQIFKRRKLNNRGVSSLATHSISGNSECIPVSIPVRQVSKVAERYVPEPIPQSSHPWAVVSTSGECLFENCRNFINKELDDILMRLHGLEKYAMIKKEQLAILKSSKGNYLKAINHALENYIRVGYVPKELSVSVCVLLNMQGARDIINGWIVPKAVRFMLHKCIDFKAIENRSLVLESMIQSFTSKFYEFISKSDIQEKRIRDTLTIYYHHVKNIIRKGNILLETKSNLYHNSGRFLYQAMEDSLKNLLSVHPCNIRKSGYYTKYLKDKHYGNRPYHSPVVSFPLLPTNSSIHHLHFAPLLPSLTWGQSSS